MTGQIVIRSSPVTTNRRLFRSSPISRPNSTTPTPTKTYRKSTSNVGEVAGGTAADICVVCCCCPCVVVEFIILAVYKVPATVVRHVWKRRRQMVLIRNKKNKNRILEHAKDVAVNGGGAGGGGGGGVNHHRHHHRQVVVEYVDELSDVDLKEFEKVKISIDGSAEAVELDKQMWDRFRDAGFWRSPSQRLDDQVTIPPDHPYLLDGLAFE